METAASYKQIPEALRGVTTSVRLAAPIVGLSVGATYRAAKRGDIETIQIGTTVRVLCAPLRRKLGLEEASSATQVAA